MTRLGKVHLTRDELLFSETVTRTWYEVIKHVNEKQRGDFLLEGRIDLSKKSISKAVVRKNFLTGSNWSNEFQYNLYSFTNTV